jgi:hypothetical protein
VERRKHACQEGDRDQAPSALEMWGGGGATVVTPDFPQLLFCHRKKRMLNVEPGNANYAITVLPLHFVISTTKG